MTDPDYVVIRRGLDVPDEWHIGDLDGKWFDRSKIPVRVADPSKVAAFRDSGGAASGATAVPTGRFEVRDDGAVAEVFELRPLFV